jgi:hypothetical protein
MTDPADDFRAAYEFAFRRFVVHADETLLRAAYELGRDAVGRQLSVLALAVVHHDVLLATVRRASTPADVAHAIEAAGQFFLESLSAYEMVRRGFVETQEAAQMERRHAEMLRQLSTFLADASLASDAEASADEILRLVAEQARDLIGAEWCIASVTAHDTTGAVEAVSTAAGAPAADDPAAWSRGPWAFETVPTPHDAPDRTDAGVSGSTPDDVAAGAPPPLTTEVLCTPLMALDGRRLGEIRLGGSGAGGVTGVDRAVLVHLAQMAAAALERTRLYRGRL